MKFLIILGFLLGLGGVLTAAGLAPIDAHERIASRASVANNGGRLETFIIRLPADRIASTGRIGDGAASIDPAARIEAPALSTADEYLIEHFKLRNIDGDVIGVAMRHWTRADDESAGTWSVSLPSRGTLVWTVNGDAQALLRAALAGAGAQRGGAWQGAVTVTLAGPTNAGQVLTGTQEFVNSSGIVEEVWEVSGVGVNGELRGTIALNTRVSQVR